MRVHGIPHTLVSDTGRFGPNDHDVAIRYTLGHEHGLDNRRITEILSELHGQRAGTTIPFESKDGKDYLLQVGTSRNYLILQRESDW